MKIADYDIIAKFPKSLAELGIDLTRLLTKNIIHCNVIASSFTDRKLLCVITVLVCTDAH